MAEVRAVLTDGATPSRRIGAIIALVSASGTLPQFYREIPWSSEVYTRGKDLERGRWWAAAVSAAVNRTTVAIVANPVQG